MATQRLDQSPASAKADAGQTNHGWMGMAWGALARPAAARLVLGIGLMATVLASFGAWQQARSRDEARFYARTEVLQGEIIQEMDRYVGILNGAQALWAMHPPAVPEEWRAYVERLGLSNSFPQLHALGFIERVPVANQAQLEEQVRRQRAGDVGSGETEIRQEGYLVRFVEPLDPNRPALDYDIASEPNRREAADKARDTGLATLTRKIKLVQAPQAPGALLLLPVYSPAIQTTNLTLRRASLLGWVYAAFLVEDLLSPVLRMNGEELEVQVFDGKSLSPGTQLFPSGRPTEPGDPAARVPFERITQLHYGNHVWTLRFKTGPAFVPTPWLSSPGYAAAAGLGLCISLLATGIARALASTQRRARALADEMTNKLQLQHHAITCATNGIFILDARRQDCPIIYANPAFENMTGYSAAEPLGDETLYLLREGASRIDLPGMRALLQEAAANHTVVRRYLRDGAEFWTEFRLVPVRDQHGQTTHFLGIVEDVTERKHVEDRLARAQQRYHELVNNLPVGIYRNTPGDQGRFLEVNSALIGMLEAASKEELIRYNVSDFYVNPSRRKELSHLILRRGFVKDVEVELHTLKGRNFWGSITATSKTDEDGAVYFDGIVVDISERKEAERALQESEERFALAVLGTNDGIWDWNVVTDEVYFSPRWKGMLGYSDDEVENTFAGWRSLVHPDDLERALAGIQAYFSGQVETYELEHRLRHKDGKYRWILARGVVLRDTHGKPLRMAGSHVDLTARKEAEEQLRVACRELAASQQALKHTVKQLKASHDELQQTQLQLIQAAKLESIGTLAAGVAHEVKNPLQTILIGLGYIERALRAQEPNVLLAIGDMRDAVLRADTIVRELLQLSAQTPFELNPGDLNAVVERSQRLLHSEIVAGRTKLICCLEPSLPRMQMDPRKLEQVLLNLMINALQAMEQDGTLRITTRTGRLGAQLQLNGAIASKFSPGESLVVAEVQDTGPGIAPELLPRIFDPFFTTKTVGKGTGLGLSVVKKIIDLHQGALEVRNAPQGGVLVTLAFRAEGEKA